jgi:hypothetical protein
MYNQNTFINTIEALEGAFDALKKLRGETFDPDDLGYLSTMRDIQCTVHQMNRYCDFVGDHVTADFADCVLHGMHSYMDQYDPKDYM